MKSPVPKIVSQRSFPSISSILNPATPSPYKIESAFPCGSESVFGQFAHSTVDSVPSTPRLSTEHTRASAKLITLREAAVLLSVKPSTIYYWSSRGDIQPIRLGRHLRFDRQDLLQHFKKIGSDAKEPRRSQAAKKSEVLSQLRSLKSKLPKSADRSKKE